MDSYLQDPLTQAIIDLLAQYSEVEPSLITRDTRIQEDLGLDSIDAAALLIVLEDRIDTEIEIEDLEGIATVGAIVDGLASMPDVASAFVDASTSADLTTPLVTGD